MSASPEDVGLILHTACIKWAEANHAQMGIPVAIGQPYYLPDAILAALRAAGYVVERDWQDISTAPRDGTPVLLWCPGMNSWNRKDGMPDMVVGLWVRERYSQFERGAWYSDIGDVDQGYESTGAYFEYTPLAPTHWRPLPAPPT